jgi:hypothetical protein
MPPSTANSALWTYADGGSCKATQLGWRRSEIGQDQGGPTAGVLDISDNRCATASVATGDNDMPALRC